MAEEKSDLAKRRRLSEDAPDNARQAEDAQQRGLEKAARQRQEQQTNEGDQEEDGADEQTPGRMVSPEKSGREHEGGV
jgi:hypothetical protein